jgi:bacillithiol biosynthesis cysteine-adding enzyme BshC
VDYCKESADLRPFFAYSPQRLGDRISRLKGDPPNRRDELAAHLLAYNTRLGASRASLEHIKQLAAGALVVMTGQQPGLFTGPLYTIYKASTCIRLAQHVSRTHNCPCVPVFWNAAEDHDLPEVNQLYLLDRRDEWQKLEVAVAQEYSGWAVGEIPLQDWDGLETRLDGVLPATDFKPRLLQLLKESWRDSANWGECFSRLMLKLFGKYGLVLVDPNSPSIRRLMVPVWERVLEAPLLPGRLVNRAGEELKRAGYKIQMRRSPQSCSFFLFEGHKRQAVSFSGGRFHTPTASFSPTQLSSMLRQTPERFSPSVVLRPIIADHIFDTAVYVAGPGEVAYFPQLKAVYEHFQVPMPLIWPRASLTIIEARIKKILDKYGLEPIRLQGDVGRIMGELTRRRNRLASVALWEQTKQAALAPLHRLGEEASASDQALAAAIETAAGKIAWQLNQLETKTIQLYKKREQELSVQLRRAKNCLFPEQRLQERRLNLIYFLNKYGFDWLGGLVESIPLEYGTHYFMTLQALTG